MFFVVFTMVVMNIRANRRKADMFAVKNKTEATPGFAQNINDSDAICVNKI